MTMNEINKTLYIPLYGKALISKRGIILQDRSAEQIWEQEGFQLKGKSKSKWLALYMSMRASVFDRWLMGKMETHPDALILNIGCGLDGRISRIGNQGHHWYDIDFPQVIDQRKKHFSETEGYTMLGADIRDPRWINAIPEAEEAIVLLEGVSMYMEKQELLQLLTLLRNRFSCLHLFMDCYSVLAAKISKYKNPVNDVGVRTLYGIDDPKELLPAGLDFLARYELAPDYLIDELSPAEQRFFRKFFAGSFAKKLYRLYEFCVYPLDLGETE